MNKINDLINRRNTILNEAQQLLNEGKLDDAKAKRNEANLIKDQIEEQKKLDAELANEIENQIENIAKAPINNPKETANALRAIINKAMNKPLTEAENALLLPRVDGNGEEYILPQDISTKIRELVRQMKSLRTVVGYIPAKAMTGSFPVEAFETVTELIDFTDGTDGEEEDGIKFKNVPYSLKEKGALIKLSNTLIQMTDNDLIAYVAKVFAKKAIVTENKLILAALKKGKTAKALADWKALRKSINTDLDPAVLYNAVVVTNQDGFDFLDSQEVDGKPILQPDPTQPSRILFKGLPIEVYSNALLATTSNKAPIIYGSLEDAVQVVDKGQYSFALSSEAGFKSNSTFGRIIEFIDVVQSDASDKCYIVGEIAITPAV